MEAISIAERELARLREGGCVFVEAEIVENDENYEIFLHGYDTEEIRKKLQLTGGTS